MEMASLCLPMQRPVVSPARSETTNGLVLEMGQADHEEAFAARDWLVGDHADGGPL